MGSMGFVSRAIDKLPLWAKLICMAFALLGGVYYVVHYGFFSFYI